MDIMVTLRGIENEDISQEHVHSILRGLGVDAKTDADGRKWVMIKGTVTAEKLFDLLNQIDQPTAI